MDLSAVPADRNKRVVYLSGQMSGLPGYGYEAFNDAADNLRSLGLVVINPAETAGGVDHMPREWYFRFDFAVIAVCDAMVVLPNWQDSKGAKAEVIVATEIGLPVYEYDPELGRAGKRLYVADWEVKTDG